MTAESARRQPEVLILGHSFVRRLRDDIFDLKCDFREDFGLDLHSRFWCKGGLKIPVARSLIDNRMVRPAVVVFIQMGGNDFVRGMADAPSVVDSLLSFASFVRTAYQAEFVVVGKLFHRNRSQFLPRPADVKEYNGKVRLANSLLNLKAQSCGVVFWRHRGIEVSWESLLASDGTHLNLEKGQPMFYRSVRGALIFASRRM